MTERFVNVDGARVFVRIVGEGEAVLTFTGAGHNSGMWTPVLERIGDGFRMVLHDFRGSGRSAPGPGDAYTFERYADDAAQVLDALGIDRAIVWGCAFGSRAAFTFAARHHGRVRLLCLFDASMDAADPVAQREGGRRAREARQAAGVPDVHYDRDAWTAHEHPDAARMTFTAGRRQPSQRHLVGKVSVPALVATGEHDPNLASSRQIVEALPDAELAVLEHTGHGSIVQRPDECVRVFRDFVARRS